MFILSEQKDILLFSSHAARLSLSVCSGYLFILPSFYISQHPSTHSGCLTIILSLYLSFCLAPSPRLSNYLSIHPSRPCLSVRSFPFTCLCLFISVCSLSLSVCPSISHCLCQTLLFHWIWSNVEFLLVKSGGKLLLWLTLNFPLRFHLWLKQRSITSQRVFCPDRWWKEITLTSLIGVCAEVS